MNKLKNILFTALAFNLMSFVAFAHHESSTVVSEEAVDGTTLLIILAIVVIIIATWAVLNRKK